jgi:hypothetical protein
METSRALIALNLMPTLPGPPAPPARTPSTDLITANRSGRLSISCSVWMVGPGMTSSREPSMSVAAESSVVSRWNWRPSTRLPTAKAWFSREGFLHGKLCQRTVGLALSGRLLGGGRPSQPTQEVAFPLCRTKLGTRQLGYASNHCLQVFCTPAAEGLGPKHG